MVIKEVKRLEIPTLLFLQACCVPVSWQPRHIHTGKAVDVWHGSFGLLIGEAIISQGFSISTFILRQDGFAEGRQHG